MEPVSRVRCKVHATVEGDYITLRAEYDPNLPEDQRFAQATPFLEGRALVNNPAARKFVEENGPAFYLDLTPATPRAPAGSDR